MEVGGSRMSVHVTGMSYATDHDGEEVTLTVYRMSPIYTSFGGHEAKAADIPADMADALREWLKGAPTQGTENSE